MLDLNNLKELYIGKTYNYLTVIDVYREYNTIFFICKCVCGNITNIRKTRVINNVSKSCGCYRKSKEFSDKQRQWSKNHQDITDRNIKALRQWHSGDQLRKKDVIMKNDYSELLNILHPKYHEDFLCGRILSNSVVETICPICRCYAEHKLKHVFMFNSRALRRNHQTMCKSCAANLTMSHYEQEIVNFISTFYNDTCVRNSRSIISPFELDLYYPEKKIAIEFNGDYWHSDLFKDRDYHYNKFRMCLENNILLVSIFETSWNNDKQNIKQYIIDLFSGVDNDISFVNDKQLVNNNYPPPSKLTTSGLIDNCYSINNLTIYTCGYSVL